MSSGVWIYVQVRLDLVHFIKHLGCLVDSLLAGDNLLNLLELCINGWNMNGIGARTLNRDMQKDRG